MKPFTNICLMLHNHQPVGNPDENIENTFNCAYYPFFDVLDRHPGIKAALHFSGIVFEWIEKKYPHFLDRLARAAERGQIEILTGGYYEPILSLIDKDDAVEQINRLSRKLKDRIGVEAKGLWLAERVWDPHLIPVLKECGIEWVVVDEIHLVNAGLPQNEMGPVIAEHLGDTVLLIPADKQLRYSMPYDSVEKTLDYIRSKAGFDEKSLILAADDGEKFGDWPGSFRILYEEGWLDALFDRLERDSDVFKTVLPSEHLSSFVPRQVLRVPPASYEEMMSWTLPAEKAIDLAFARDLAADDDVRKYMHPGYYPSFFTKYPESNLLHKRMLDVSRRMRKAMKDLNGELDMAYTEVLSAQCNCAYWHGVFGGIYLPHLRGALNYHLNRAAFPLESVTGQEFSYRKLDIDADREDEIILSSPSMRLLIKERGGAIAALDHADSSLNLCDVLARRVERYHPDMMDGFARDEEPATDWYPRHTLIDHFFSSSLTLSDLKKSVCAEQGDFVDGMYSSHIKGDDDCHVLTLEKHGKVITSEGLTPVSITKTITMYRNTPDFDVEYRLFSSTGVSEELHFGTEFNLALPWVDNDRCFAITPERVPLSSSGVMEACEHFEAAHGTVNILFSLESELPADIYYYPVETSSVYHSKHERIQQGFCFIPSWRIKLNKGEPITLKLKCRFSAFQG